MADPSRSEKATARRRQDYRKKGSVAKSVEINTAAILLAAFLYLKFAGGFIYGHLLQIFRFYFENLNTIDVGQESLLNVAFNATFHIVILTVPFLLFMMLVVMVASWLQIGFMFTLEPIKPSFSKINILKGFQNLFSKRSLETLIKSLAKVIIIGYIVYSTIRKDIPIMIDFFNIPIENAFLILCKLAMDVLLKIILAFVVLAGIDYLFQRWQLEEQMKMTKQEIKEEYKRTEGDPTIKAEIRRRQHEMARHRMMQDVPKADVVITNPIHVAVAIKYNATEMRAPIVIAKGMNLVAEKIKQLATENDIPMVENPPLARALYKSAKVGKEIPADMYSVVAEVLTYLYRLKGKTFGVI